MLENSEGNRPPLVAMNGDACEDEIEVFTVEAIGPYEFSLQVAEDDFNNAKKTLFATMIWHGSRALSKHILSHVSDSIRGKSVIEFGAGAGLPSLICHRVGAAIVTSSDYPARSVTRNLIRNASRNIIYNETSATQSSHQDNGNEEDCIVRDSLLLSEKNFYVIEHVWGEDVSPLLYPVHAAGEKYDVVIASECLW